jgi:hypothetical protein
MKYLMLHAVDQDAMPSEPTGATPEALDAWVDEMLARGVLLDAARLHPVSDATTVRTADGSPVVTDGPFAETKDLIAGWMVIDVDSYERAIELAGDLSAAPGAGGEPIHEWLEVRPVLAEPPTITE